MMISLSGYISYQFIMVLIHKAQLFVETHMFICTPSEFSTSVFVSECAFLTMRSLAARKLIILKCIKHKIILYQALSQQISHAPSLAYLKWED